MMRMINMIRFLKNILISISDTLMSIAASLPGVKKKENDEPKYLGGGASTEVPQSFHVDKEKLKRGRPKGVKNDKKVKTRK